MSYVDVLRRCLASYGKTSRYHVSGCGRKLGLEAEFPRKPPLLDRWVDLPQCWSVRSEQPLEQRRGKEGGLGGETGASGSPPNCGAGEEHQAGRKVAVAAREWRLVHLRGSTSRRRARVERAGVDGVDRGVFRERWEVHQAVESPPWLGFTPAGAGTSSVCARFFRGFFGVRFPEEPRKNRHKRSTAWVGPPGFHGR